MAASWPVAALCGFDLAALVFVLWVWAGVAGADATTTESIARAEDASPRSRRGVLIGAGAASLVAVAFALAAAGDAVAPARGLLTALAFVSVTLAWIAVHTVWALRYARLYYSPPAGGIDFGGDDPDYTDFAYLALTIGMTFQVSDTALSAQTHPPGRPPPRAAVVSLRHRDRGDHGEHGREAPHLSAA